MWLFFQFEATIEHLGSMRSALSTNFCLGPWILLNIIKFFTTNEKDRAKLINNIERQIKNGRATSLGPWVLRNPPLWNTRKRWKLEN